MGKSRPPAGRPPGRRGRGGVGPGPGYRTPGHGKGTSHSSMMAAPRPILWALNALFVGVPVTVVASLTVWLLRGYGVL